MQTFLVERNLAGIDTAELYQMAAASYRGAAQLRSRGSKIFYLGSTFLPQDGRCFCLFEAGEVATVSRLSRDARLSVTRISPALTFAAPPVLVT
jgi:hypothetical protein